jgi:ferredoxin
MPTIQFQHQTIEVETGENLRTALLRAGAPLYNGHARWLNCRGLGTCGTCAVFVQGHLSEPTAVEKARLRFPPHTPQEGLRLACQCRVLGSVVLEKGEGFWGQHPLNSIK